MLPVPRFTLDADQQSLQNARLDFADLSHRQSTSCCQQLQEIDTERMRRPVALVEEGILRTLKVVGTKEPHESLVHVIEVGWLQC